MKHLADCLVLRDSFIPRSFFNEYAEIIWTFLQISTWKQPWADIIVQF